jgi:hypothetical protein
MSNFNREDLIGALVQYDLVVMDYIKKHIAFDFQIDGKTITTDVRITNPERWSISINEPNKKDQLQNLKNLPLITIARTDLDIITGRTPKAVSDELYSYIVNKINKKTISPLPNQKEYTVVRLPKSVDLFYSIMIISDKKSHNNKLVERFVMEQGKYWSLDGYPVYVNFENIGDASQNADQNQERLIRSTISLRLDNVKILTGVKYDGKNRIKKVQSLKGIEVGLEADVSSEEFERLTDENKYSTRYPNLNPIPRLF